LLRHTVVTSGHLNTQKYTLLNGTYCLYKWHTMRIL